MIKSRIPYSLRSISFWMSMAASFTIGVAGFCLNFSPENIARQGLVISEILTWVQQNAANIALVGAGFGVLGTIVSRYISDQRVWKAIHALLDDFRIKSCEVDVPDHKHKVTLFKYQKWCWCWRGLNLRSSPFWSGWLIPVERSGRRNLSTSALFHAPQNGAHRAEGIAGLCWKDETDVALKGISTPTSVSDRQGITNYSAATNIKDSAVIRYLRKNKPLPCSFFATVVEVDNAPWGVLVIDSESKDICDQKNLVKHYRVLALGLDCILGSFGGNEND